MLKGSRSITKDEMQCTSAEYRCCARISVSQRERGVSIKILTHPGHCKSHVQSPSGASRLVY